MSDIEVAEWGRFGVGGLGRGFCNGREECGSVWMVAWMAKCFARELFGSTVVCLFGVNYQVA
jgi:hypothetical protein